MYYIIVAKQRRTKQVDGKKEDHTLSQIQLGGYDQYNQKPNISSASPETYRNVTAAFAQRVNSLSNTEGAHFEANLTNLAGANNLLMNDVIADMVDNDYGEDNIVTANGHITAGGDVIDMNESEETDETDENVMNNDDDATPPTNENNFTDDDEIILDGIQTVGHNYRKEGGDINDDMESPPQPPKIQNNDSDDKVLNEIETLGKDMNIDSDTEGTDENYVNNVNEDPQVIGDDEIIGDRNTALPPPPPRQNY